MLMHFCSRVWSNEKYFLIALFITSLIARLLFFYTFLYDNPMMLAYDSAHYHGVAQSLLQGLGFSNADGSVHLYRVPGYSLFWAQCLFLGRGNVHAALGVQIVVASFIPLLVYVLAKQLFPTIFLLPRLVALITAVHGGFMIFSGLVMAESLFVLLFLLALIFFFKGIGKMVGKGNMCSILRYNTPLVLSILRSKMYRRMRGVTQDERQESSSQKRYFIFSGLLAGCAALIRPAGLYLLLWFPIVLLMLVGLHKKTIKALVLFCCACGLVICSWMVRNYMHTGFFVLHTFPGHHMINHGAARVVMMAKGVTYEQAQAVLQKGIEEEWLQEKGEQNKESFFYYNWDFVPNPTRISSWTYGPHQEVAKSLLMQKIAQKIFFTYPKQTIQLCVINGLKTVFSLYSSELLFIDSGGKLPAYEQKRTVSSMVQRFICPDVHKPKIRFVIYAEILFHLFLFLSLLGCLWFLVRRRFDRQTTKMILALGFLCVLCILPTGLCGFARLRLPIEPFFIMLGLAFWLHKQKGESEL